MEQGKCVSENELEIENKLLEIGNELLDIAYNQDEFTTSDFQGAIDAQVRKAFLLGKEAKI